MKKLTPFFLVLSSFAFGQTTAIVKDRGILLDDSSILGNVIMRFNGNTKITILENAGDFYKTCYNDKCGYISEVWLEQSDELKKMKSDNAETWKEKQNLIEKDRLIKIKEEDNRRLAERITLYTKKYGKTNGTLVAKNMIQTGMTKDMVIDSRGLPETINETVTSWGTRQQWVYKSSYLYFENGKLISWQTSY